MLSKNSFCVIILPFLVLESVIDFLVLLKRFTSS
nr:MAG TPA: hypothetical protein [Caudoviricetes sp.]